MQTGVRSKTLLPYAFIRYLLAASVLLSYSRQATAQTTFPRQESFTTNTATGFRLGGSATLTGTTASSTDGVLRLTTNVTNQAGFAIDQYSFPAPSGFSISFEYFSYGGTGADGFSVFLIDADKTTAATFTSGATGGSLGYAQKSAGTPEAGVPNGYIGIGIDEFGNYSNPTEGRVGGTGKVADAIAIRGSGLGQSPTSTTDYPYLAGSGALPFSLDVSGTSRVTDPLDPNYRRAYIDVVPQRDGTYKIKVRIQHGLEVETAISDVTVPVPPDRLRIGFAGSTGSSTNFHEIRNLAILQAPIANDDRVSTKYNQPITLNARANDVFTYSNYLPGTFDLNPSATGVQTTYTVSGKGTFTVDSDGQVTFVPIGSFAGVVTIPYTVQDVNGSKATPAYVSNPATITVVVTGADVATSLDGPGSANPGAKVTYTVNTTNIGVETAINVIPTLTLDFKPAAGTVTLPAGAVYDATTGVVSFARSTLAANGSVSNSVTFTMPATGSVKGTASYTYPSGAVVPDPVITNNTAELTTNVAGIANVATGCASPGKDGPATLNGSAVPNAYYPATASAAKSTRQITLGQSTGATTGIQPGDLLLVMQMQSAQILASNSATYGSNGTSGSGSISGTAGQYEYAVAANSVPVGGGTLLLANGLTNDYENNPFVATDSLGQRTFQVIRVPQYSALAVTGTVTGAAWNGSTGGVLAVDVLGATTFTGTASLSMTGKGFRGGGGVSSTTAAPGTNTSYRTSTGGNGAKGEGTAGAPRRINVDYTSVITTGPGYRKGNNGRGAPGNAGGGATDFSTTNNSQNTGGAGGGNGGAGGLGGYGYNQNTGTGVIENRAIGGAAVTPSSTRLTLGGGGGAGSTNDGSGTPAGGIASSGAPGGGLIMVRTGTVTGTATITANGGDTPAVGDDGGGGGGAGGSILFFAATAPATRALTMTANGGKGGSSTGTNAHGPGGGGGGGVIYSNAANTATAAGGSSGYAQNGTTNKFGATDGGTGSTPTPASTDLNSGITAKADCMPMLTAALSTATPNITRGSNNAVNPATYVLTVSNTGGQANSVSATILMDESNGQATSGKFTYSSTNTTVKITLADGTVDTLAVGTGYTAPAANASAPVFSGIALPAGATLSITFRAAIASSAVNGVKYQSAATVSYLDPTRTTASATTTPGGTYATSGTVPGSNYASASSTREDVIITQPLPVELKKFEATAIRQDAQLTWSTASEKDNDRFEVERSLDGYVFVPIGTVKGAGYSTRELTYRYLDANAARLGEGQPLYYRLRQADTDGAATYSPVRSIRFEGVRQTAVSVYPNPAQGQATLDLTGLPAGSYQVRLLDMTGRVLREQTLAGQQQHTLPVAELALGSYLVQVRGSNVSITLPLLRN